MNDRLDDALGIIDSVISDFTSGSGTAMTCLTLALSARISAVAAHGLTGTTAAPPSAQPDDGDLLTVDQAAERLRVTPDWLYRRAKSLPFMVRLGPRVLRCSAAGIERYVQGKKV